MIIHKDFNIYFGGERDFLLSTVINQNKKYRRPFQLRNNIFHFNENQHFSFNVGFFLPEISKIKYLNKI